MLKMQEVSFQRKRRDVPTGIRLFSNEWDDKKHVVIVLIVLN